MRKLSALLSIVCFSLLLSASIAVAKGSLTVTFSGVGAEVKHNAPFKGTLIVKLADFSKPVDVIVSLTLKDGLNFLAESSPVVMHARGNGTYKLPLSTTFHLYASVEYAGMSLLYGVARVQGQPPVTCSGIIKILKPSGEVSLVLDSAEFNQSRGRARQTLAFALNYFVSVPPNKHLAVETRETITVVGHPEMAIKPETKSLFVKGSAKAGNTFPMTFKQPGHYVVKYQVTAEGAEPLVGEEEIAVDEAAPGNWAGEWHSAANASNIITLTGEWGHFSGRNDAEPSKEQYWHHTLSNFKYLSPTHVTCELNGTYVDPGKSIKCHALLDLVLSDNRIALTCTNIDRTITPPSAESGVCVPGTVGRDTLVRAK